MTIRMTHPHLPGQPVEVADSAVPHHRAAGWQVVEGQASQGEEWPLEAQRFEGQPMVRMSHPNLPYTGQEPIVVAESAVPAHRSTGWLVVEDEPASEASEAESEAGPDELDGLTVAELQQRARDRGLPVSGTKAELLARLCTADETSEAGDEPAPDTEGAEA